MSTFLNITGVTQLASSCAKKMLSYIHHTQKQGKSCPVLDDYPQEINHEKPDKYLASGKQTETGKLVQSAAMEACQRGLDYGGSGLDYFRAVNEVLHERLFTKVNNKESHTRTAEETLEVGYATGCTDYAVAGAAILREMGYPTIFVDSAHRDFLDGNLDETQYRGHSFLEVFDENNKDCIMEGGCWLLYDPTAAKLYTKYNPTIDTLPDPSSESLGSYLVLAKGPDPWSMGIEALAPAEHICMDRFRDEYYDRGNVDFEDIDYPVMDL